MIRKLRQADREQLEKLLNKTVQFNNDEKSVALELIDTAIQNGKQSDYHIYVYETDGMITGYHCTGKRPLTDGVYDLYWIVADPEQRGKGIGGALLKHAETFVTDNNGRWILAETSSRESYEGTRNFYHRNNYTIVAQISDFYSIGDKLVVFGKYLQK